VHLVGFIIRIYHDARSRERKIRLCDLYNWKNEQDLPAVREFIHKIQWFYADHLGLLYLFFLFQLGIDTCILQFVITWSVNSYSCELIFITGQYCRCLSCKATYYYFIIFIFRGSTALVGHILLDVQDSRSYSDAILDRNPLDERSALHRDLYLTTHDTHKRQTSMPTAGYEPAIPASERSQTHASDRTVTGIGTHYLVILNFNWRSVICTQYSCYSPMLYQLWP
jgi:hypothetical protein